MSTTEPPAFSKPDPETPARPKTRNCLSCQRSFPSLWVGERICPKCKASSWWRSDSAAG